MSEPGLRRLTYAEYLEFEAASLEKHEFYDGNVVAMSGGTSDHALLAMNLGALGFAAFRARGCRIFGSDQRVVCPESGLATYPDLSVVCGPRDPYPPDPDALTNPVVLVEVLSPSSERSDRGEKFAHYQTLAALKTYVLVSQDRVRIEVFERTGPSSWAYQVFGPGSVVTLGAVGVSFGVDQVYEGAEFLNPPPAPPEGPPPEGPAT